MADFTREDFDRLCDRQKDLWTLTAEAVKVLPNKDTSYNCGLWLEESFSTFNTVLGKLEDYLEEQEAKARGEGVE